MRTVRAECAGEALASVITSYSIHYTKLYELEVQIGNEASRISEGLFEATVSVTVTARVGERTVRNNFV